MEMLAKQLQYFSWNFGQRNEKKNGIKALWKIMDGYGVPKDLFDTGLAFDVFINIVIGNECFFNLLLA